MRSPADLNIRAVAVGSDPHNAAGAGIHRMSGPYGRERAGIRINGEPEKLSDAAANVKEFRRYDRRRRRRWWWWWICGTRPPASSQHAEQQGKNGECSFA